MRTRTSLPLRQWLLTVALAAGLIGMHHLLAGPSAMRAGMEAMHAASPVTADHAAPDAHEQTGPATTRHSVMLATTHRVDPMPAGALPGTIAAVPAINDVAASSSSIVSVSGAGSAAMGAMAHLCLAVLVAAGLLFAAYALLAIGPLRRGPLLAATGGANAFPARAPPASAVRLSQLGVLRN